MPYHGVLAPNARLRKRVVPLTNRVSRESAQCTARKREPLVAPVSPCDVPSPSPVTEMPATAGASREDARPPEVRERPGELSRAVRSPTIERVPNHMRLLKKWKSRTIHKHFGGLDLIFSCPRYSISVSPCFSGRAEFRCFTLGEESHQSFKILGRSRQQKLFGDVPYPSQPHPT